MASIRPLARAFYESNTARQELAWKSAEHTASNSGTGGSGSQGQPFNWSLDLSDFVGESERMRVLYWARYDL